MVAVTLVRGLRDGEVIDLPRNGECGIQGSRTAEESGRTKERIQGNEK